jgi:multiple sugar transport system permease protein
MHRPGSSNRGKYILLTPLAIVFLFPFLWVVLTSLKTNPETLTNPGALLPAVPQFSNYPDVITRMNFWRELFNTVLMTLSVTFGQIIIGALAGYGFARLKFFGKSTLFLLVLGTLIIPFEILFVPIFLMLSGWHWLDSYQALIVPSLASPFSIFVFRQFFITIPKDFEEAATMDGAGPYRIFFSIMLPLSGSAIATVFILTFLGEWSNLLKPMVFNATNPDMFTLQQGLAVSLNKGANLSPDIASLMTGVVLTSVVPIAMFMLGQRFFIRSIASSGVKG